MWVGSPVVIELYHSAIESMWPIEPIQLIETIYLLIVPIEPIQTGEEFLWHMVVNFFGRLSYDRLGAQRRLSCTIHPNQL